MNIPFAEVNKLFKTDGEQGLRRDAIKNVSQALCQTQTIEIL
jgi:hypothetical protein